MIDLYVPVEIDGETFEPGVLMVAYMDGVVLHRRADGAVVRRAWDKVHAVKKVRDAIRVGMTARKTFDTFGGL